MKKECNIIYQKLMLVPRIEKVKKKKGERKKRPSIVRIKKNYRTKMLFEKNF